MKTRSLVHGLHTRRLAPDEAPSFHDAGSLAALLRKRRNGVCIEPGCDEAATGESEALGSREKFCARHGGGVPRESTP